MRKVIRVLFHDVNVVVPGIGTFQGELPSKAKMIPGLEMTEGANGVEISAAGILAIIPYANCKVYFADKATEPKAQAKK